MRLTAIALLHTAEQISEVLRVRMEIEAQDSAVIPALMIDLEFPGNQVEFRWFRRTMAQLFYKQPNY